MSPCYRLGLAPLLIGLAQPAAALSLGDQQGALRLGAPMSLDIPIQGVGEQPHGLRADVPDYLEHVRLGAADPITPKRLSARIVQQPDGRSVVRLESADGVSEPVLRFLVRLSWPGGEALREYELLLDPPAYTPRRVATPAPVASVDAARVGVAAAPGTPPRHSLARPAPRAGQRYGPVGSGDTLYTILHRAYPDHAGDLAVVADRVVAMNPAAFVGSDANRLLQGAWLDLPGKGAFAAGGSGTAARAVAPSRPAVAGAGGRYGPVRAGETLYAIARRVSGAAESQVAAIARRLHASNPGAFVGNDMNRLRVGVMLQLGDALASPVPASGAVSDAAPGEVARTTAVAPAIPPATTRSVAAGNPPPAAPATASSPDGAQASDIVSLRESLVLERERTGALMVRLERSIAQLRALKEREAALSSQIEAKRRAMQEALSRPVEPRVAAPASARVGAQPAKQTVSKPAPAIAPSPVASSDETLARAGLLDELRFTGTLTLAGIAVVVVLMMALAWRRLRARAPRFQARDDEARVDAIRHRLNPEPASVPLPAVDGTEAGAETDDPELAFAAVDPMDLDGQSDPGETSDKVVLTDAARANDLARRAAVSLAFEDYSMAKRYIDQAIALEPRREEHKMVLLTLYECMGEHARAHALMDELIERRDRMTGPMRAQVEELSRRRKA